MLMLLRPCVRHQNSLAFIGRRSEWWVLRPIKQASSTSSRNGRGRRRSVLYKFKCSNYVYHPQYEQYPSTEIYYRYALFYREILSLVHFPKVHNMGNVRTPSLIFCQVERFLKVNVKGNDSYGLSAIEPETYRKRQPSNQCFSVFVVLQLVFIQIIIYFLILLAIPSDPILTMSILTSFFKPHLFIYALLSYHLFRFVDKIEDMLDLDDNEHSRTNNIV